MRNNTLLLVLPSCLILIISPSVIGCNSPADAPSNQVEHIQVILEPCVGGIETDEYGKEYFLEAPGIIFENVTLETGVLDRGYSSPWAGKFRLGEPCFLINGTIRNEYDESNWVAHQAMGYDESGNVVSYTLDAGPISGVEQIYIDAKKAEEFTLHLNWSDNVTLFRINCQKSSVMFP